MRAFRVQPSADASNPYSETNPAPSSSIQLQDNIPMPVLRQSDDAIIQIKATTVIRDNLTWPEILQEKNPAYLGNDFSGIVTSVGEGNTTLRVGDEVYGMISAERGGAWAEYASVEANEAHLKPKNITWEEAAATPLSALTADQALFDQARLSPDGSDPKRVLITGAAGGVGTWLVQFAKSAGHHVVAATSSKARNSEYLKSFKVDQCVEYRDLSTMDPFDAIIDTAGGDVLRQCWEVVKPHGTLITVDSASWNFVEVHGGAGHSKGKEDVHAVFFVVVPSKQSMARVSKFVEDGEVEIQVSEVFRFEKAREAYELGHARHGGRGKIVLRL